MLQSMGPQRVGHNIATKLTINISPITRTTTIIITKTVIQTLQFQK